MRGRGCSNMVTSWEWVGNKEELRVIPGFWLGWLVKGGVQDKAEQASRCGEE